MLSILRYQESWNFQERSMGKSVLLFKGIALSSKITEPSGIFELVVMACSRIWECSNGILILPCLSILWKSGLHHCYPCLPWVIALANPWHMILLPPLSSTQQSIFSFEALFIHHFILLFWSIIDPQWLYYN